MSSMQFHPEFSSENSNKRATRHVLNVVSGSPALRYFLAPTQSKATTHPFFLLLVMASKHV